MVSISGIAATGIAVPQRAEPSGAEQGRRAATSGAERTPSRAAVPQRAEPSGAEQGRRAAEQGRRAATSGAEQGSRKNANPDFGFAEKREP